MRNQDRNLSERQGNEARTEKKKPKKFKLYMQKKLAVLFVLIILAFIVLGIRMIWIIKEEGASYNKEILQQQEYDSTTLPYKRGDIVDAKGTKLAVSEKYYNLVIDAKVINYDLEKYFEPTMEALSIAFPQLDMAVIRKHVTTNTSSAYYVPLKLLTYQQKSVFDDLEEADENNYIRGVWFEEEYKRIYPFNTLACDVIGFTGKDNAGTYGLEEWYNDVLNGTTGREYGYLGDDSTLERTIKPAVDGYTIHSTIDVNIQSIVEKYLYKFNEENKNAVRQGNGAENVGCVIQRIHTGEILAMASYPNFDLNNTKDISALVGNVMVDENGKKTDQYITQELAEQMLQAEDNTLLYQNLNYLWKNFCISDTYEPGSTAKPFTVATALETGAITGNEVYNCTGKLHIGGHDIHCHVRGGEGSVTVQNSIAWSCNVAMMHMGQAIGKANFSKFQQIFNFGLKTNVDLAGEARTVGLLFDENMGDADLATNTFGQNFNVTMIQMITGFSSLINGGNYYEPHLVDKITDSSGAVIENIEPRVLKQTVSESTSEKIVQYCTAVVMPEGGSARTGKTARPAGYAIGGKTGTAQTLPRGNKEYVVSFMGFAPADDPEIAIYVVVDRPNAAKQDDAKFATRIVRNVLTEVLPYLNIYMTEELSETEIAELEALKLENTYGMGETLEQEAADSLENTEADSSGQYQEAPFKNYEKDPATGYLIDPVTKQLLDPDTGEPVYDSIQAITW